MGFRITSKNTIKLIIFFALFGAVLAIVFLFKLGFFDNFIQQNKPTTEYNSYSDFLEDAGYFYPSLVPKSAENMEFYCIHNDEIFQSAIAFNVSSEEWDSIHEYYVNDLGQTETYTIYSEDKLTNDFITQRKVEYLNNFFGDSYEGYMLMPAGTRDYDHMDVTQGVIYSEEQKRVIIFDSTIFK